MLPHKYVCEVRIGSNNALGGG